MRSSVMRMQDTHSSTVHALNYGVDYLISYPDFLPKFIHSAKPHQETLY